MMIELVACLIFSIGCVLWLFSFVTFLAVVYMISIFLGLVQVIHVFCFGDLT